MNGEEEELPSASNPMPTVSALPGIGLLKDRNEKKRRLGFGEKLPPVKAEQVPMIAEVERHLSALLTPAKKTEIKRMIEALMWHYPQYPKPDYAVESVAIDWMADLKQFPADIIRAACIGWRRSPASSAPTPGQLLELATPILTARRYWYHLASETIAPFASPGSVSPGGVEAGRAGLSAGGVSKLRRGA